MSLNDDLALVTACRDALAKAAPIGTWAVSDRVPGEVWAGRDAAGWDGFLIATTETRLNKADPDMAALIATLPTVYSAALSLIEDTLNRHAPDHPDEDSATGEMGDPGCTACDNYASMKLKPWPCPDYAATAAALNAIAPALGIETP